MYDNEEERPVHPHIEHRHWKRVLKDTYGEGFFTVEEVAEIVGVSKHTLRDYYNKDDENLQPSIKIKYGKALVIFYTEDDIRRIKEWVYAKHGDKPSRGRPKTYSDEESEYRNRLRVRRRYWGLVREEAEFMGDESRYLKAEEILEKIEKKLGDMDG